MSYCPACPEPHLMPTMDASDGDGNGVCFPYDVLLEIPKRLPRVAAAHRRPPPAPRPLLPQARLPGHLPLQGRLPLQLRLLRAALLHQEAAASSLPAAGVPARLGQGRALQQRLLLVDVKDRWAGCYHVCNPATARCAPLPRPPLPSMYDVEAAYIAIAFDPAVSLH